MAKIKSQFEDEPNDSFTSMIDIVFLLLIFFILQPFKQPEMKLAAELPKDEGPSHTPSEPRQHIVIKIEPEGADGSEARFIVDGQTIAGPAISSRLLKRNGGDLEAPIALMPNIKTHFRHVLMALDECYEARMPNVKFEGPPLDTYVPGQDGRK